jgi:hypothetical protein
MDNGLTKRGVQWGAGDRRRSAVPGAVRTSMRRDGPQQAQPHGPYTSSKTQVNKRAPRRGASTAMSLPTPARRLCRYTLLLNGLLPPAGTSSNTVPPQRADRPRGHGTEPKPQV